MRDRTPHEVGRRHALPAVLGALDERLDRTSVDVERAEHLGIVGFFVEPKHEEAAKFYRRFSFLPLPDNALELFLPLATIREAFEKK
jgi:hypothetical protein